MALNFTTIALRTHTMFMPRRKLFRDSKTTHTRERWCIDIKN